MVTGEQLPTSTNRYVHKFHRYILNGVSETLRIIRNIEGKIPTEQRADAWHILSYALASPEAWPQTSILLLTLAPRMEQEGYRDEWMYYLETGISFSERLQDQATEAELSLHVGSLYLLKGNFSDARYWFERSLDRYKSLGQSRGQGVVFNRLAFVAQRQDAYTEAKQFVDSALELLEADDSERANSFTALGEIALGERKWEKAETYFGQAIKVWKNQPDERRMAWGLRNHGEALRWQERYSEAITCYEQAIELLTRLQDPVNLATVQVNLGIIYSKTGQEKKALRLYGQAETTFQKTQDRAYLAILYTNMAIAYRQLTQWNAAEKACLASIEIKKEVGDIYSLLNTKDELGLVYHGKKQYAKAIKTFQDAIALVPQVELSQRRQYLQDMLQTHLCESEEASRRAASIS